MVTLVGTDVFLSCVDITRRKFDPILLICILIPLVEIGLVKIRLAVTKNL